jgi:DNA invertase Pin-like site-specific DNA recombinase
MLALLPADTEMERDLLVERTQAGLKRARAEGRTLGRPRKTNKEQRTSAAKASAPAVRDFSVDHGTQAGLATSRAGATNPIFRQLPFDNCSYVKDTLAHYKS